MLNVPRQLKYIYFTLPHRVQCTFASLSCNVYLTLSHNTICGLMQRDARQDLE
jgi:hypothetical protein